MPFDGVSSIIIQPSSANNEMIIETAPIISQSTLSSKKSIQSSTATSTSNTQKRIQNKEETVENSTKLK